MRNNRILFVAIAMIVLLLQASAVYAEVYIPFADSGVEQVPDASIAAVAPYAAAPECTNHDPRKWHGLWNGQLGCYYDHEHGDNPHEVDDIFGTQFYAIAGGEISYPWATDGENHMEHKHESQKWFVRRDLNCYSQYTSGCVKAVRAQIHGDLHNVASEFHSYAIEVLICPEAAPNDCGIVRTGGWQAVGDLTIDAEVVINRTEPPRVPRPVLLHYATVGNPKFATWYPVSPGGIIRISQETGDMWGYYPRPAGVPVSTLTLNNFDFFCDVNAATGQANAGCRSNGTRRQLHIVGVSIPAQLRATLDPDGNGRITYQGYTNRYGHIVQGCTSVSLDCVPLRFENVRISPDGMWQLRSTYREYDVTPAGANWVRFPN
jgi:hypothetical protein